MATCNIRFSCGHLVEVEVCREFEMYGRKFIVHQHTAGHMWGYSVCEYETGLKVPYDRPLITAGSPESAETHARETMMRRGKAQILAMIKNALSKLGPANKKEES